MKQGLSVEIIKKIYRNGYDGALEECFRRIGKGEKTAVFTPNAEMLCKASKESAELLLSANILFPDGVGVHIAAMMMGYPISERTCGIDLAQRILKRSAAEGMRVFLLGGRPGVAVSAAEKLSRKYKGLCICGACHGYFEDDHEIIRLIESSRADILFVCLGFPKQEKWIKNNLPKIHCVKLAIGLGGSLDVWSGQVKRAPRAVSDAGFEWLWRMMNQPKRLLRAPQLSLFPFLMLKDAIINRKKFSKCNEIDKFLK